MCGICGFTGPPDRSLLDQMVTTLTHRGPDDFGVFTDGQVSLGMRRLSIVDLDTGQQPVHNEDKTIWCVFNGEIYNFIEMKAALERKGHRFYTDHSDTEVLVHAYEEHGLDFVQHLNGMFAIALWDTTQQQLVLIRDRMGVKPLFFHIHQGEVSFASEIKALLKHPQIKAEPNFQALYHYFSFKNIPSPLTAFQGIQALRPGEMLIWSPQGIQQRPWWQLRFRPQPDMSQAEAQAPILSLLEDATQIRMRTDVPFGAYLSGGVDSSAVVALMSQILGKNVVTFSLGYQDGLSHKDADLQFARQISQQFHTEHHEYMMSSKELQDDLPLVLRAFDQPFSGTISTFFLSKLISRHVKVALSGDGADELFGSYLTHRTANPMHHFARLHTQYKQGLLTPAELNLLPPCTLDHLSRLYELSQGDEVIWKYHLLLATDPQKSELLSPAFKAQLTPEATTLQLLQQAYAKLTATTPLNRILELELQTQFPDQVLAFVDHLSMAHSVEVRSPFIDYRLVEWAAQVPDTWKIHQGQVKFILKEALKPLLPDSILKRPKEGFVLPVFHWMTEQLQPFVRETLSVKALNQHGLLEPVAVQSLIRDYYAGNHNRAGQLWNLLMFQVWWEIYFR